MTYAQKHGSTDMEIIIFRKLKHSNKVVAVWPYVRTSMGMIRYQYLLGLNTVETREQSYQWLIANSVAANAEDYFQLHYTLQLMGYWYSVDTRRYMSHWSLRYN